METRFPPEFILVKTRAGMTKNMKNYLKNQQVLIILFFILIFILASVWLFFLSAKYSDPNYNSEWWSIYFENPQDQSLNFVIENHSSKNNFHWEIINNGTEQQKNIVAINKGEIKKIPVDFQTEVGQKITIRISADNEVKEIYKNF